MAVEIPDFDVTVPNGVLRFIVDEELEIEDTNERDDSTRIAVIPEAPPLPRHWTSKHWTARPRLTVMSEVIELTRKGLDDEVHVVVDGDSGRGSAVDLELPALPLPFSNLSQEELRSAVLSESSSSRSSSIGSDSAYSRRSSGTGVRASRSIRIPTGASRSETDMNLVTVPPAPPPPPVSFFVPIVGTPSWRSRSSQSEGLRRVRPRDIDVHCDVEVSADNPNICVVCYESLGSNRTCCGTCVCASCMFNVVLTNIGDGDPYVECPASDCTKALGKEEVLRLIDARGYLTEVKEKYIRLRVNAGEEEGKKTCPNCSFVQEKELPKLGLFKRWRYREEEIRVRCQSCDHDWCFACHSPWHNDVDCKTFRKGEKQFRSWTKGQTVTGVANCQKCPICRVHIQRSTGCDCMTCNRCNTKFCYKCGEKFVTIPGLGDHYAATSILGCKYNYHPNEPHKRLTVRGGYFGCKLAMLTGYPVLFVGGVAVLLVVGAVALPIYAGYKFHVYRKNMNKLRQRRRHRRH